MRFGTLFSGIEGFGLGFERAGMRCLWQVEIDPACNRVLQRHWPGVRRYRDVREVRGDALEAVDLVAGGFPCQDLSVAGRGKGLAGERSGLWFQFHRILAEHRPRWVVIENVPGLLSSPRAAPGRDFAIILSGLVELGYRLAWRCLDAQYLGLAQRRRRLFVAGNLRDGRAAEVLFEREGGCWNPQPRKEAGARTAGTLAASAGRSRGAGSAGGMSLAYTISTRPAERMSAEDNYIVSHALTSEGADASEDGTGRGVPIVAQTLTANYGQNGGQTAGNNGRPVNLIAFDPTQITSPGNYSTPKEGDPCHPLAAHAQPPISAFDWHASGSGDTSFRGKGRAYVVRNGEYAGTVQATKQDAIQQGMAVRRLMPVECERLQGFPDGHTVGESDSARYRMLGNAMFVPGAEWLGRRIIKAEGLE